MAVGTPVITTGGTGIPEIVGDAALGSSADVDDVIAKIHLVLHDGELCESLRRAGRARAANHTWQACVDRLSAALAAGRSK
jgi:glycosyltransferase involved in cell wall biosynthesis